MAASSAGVAVAGLLAVFSADEVAGETAGAGSADFLSPRAKMQPEHSDAAAMPINAKRTVEFRQTMKMLPTGKRIVAKAWPSRLTKSGNPPTKSGGIVAKLQV